MDRRRLVIVGAAGLPQLQSRLPRSRGVRGRRVHGDPDPEHRRPPLSGRARWTSLSRRDSHPPGVQARGAGAGDDVDEVVFSYSDVTHEHVMHIGSRVLAAGASYSLLSPHRTMLTSSRPAVAVCAVPHRLRQEPDDAAHREAPAGRRQAGRRPPAPDALRRPDREPSSASPTTPTWTPPTRRSRSARSTSPTSRRATWSSRGSTTRRSSTRPSRKRT